jgi:hypothetical protein
MQVLNLVPQIFYDFIARVVPGAFVSITACCVFLDCERQKKLISNIFADSLPTVLIVFVLFLFWYAIGCVLGAIGMIPCAIFNVIKLCSRSEYKCMDKIVVRPVWSPTPSDWPDGEVSYAYDYIQYHAPAVGSHLVKLSAEISMSQAMAAGAVLVSLWFAFGSTCGCSVRWWGTGAAALTAACWWVFCRHIKVRRRWLLVNNWHLLAARRMKVHD